MGGRLEKEPSPLHSLLPLPGGNQPPDLFPFFFFISASSQSLAFTSISPPPFPPPHQPHSAHSLPHTPSSSPPSPHHTLVSPGPEKCVTPGCPMAPLTLCIPGITVWGHVPWSLGREALVGPWHQLSDSHHSPHTPSSCSCQSQLRPAALPHPCLLTSPLFLFRWAPPIHQIPTTLLPKCNQREKQNPPSVPSKTRWDGLGCTEKHQAGRHLPQTSGVLGLGRSP